MKRAIISGLLITTMVSSTAFAENKKTTCIEAWKNALSKGDMTGKELSSNAIITAGVSTTGGIGLQLSASLAFGVKVALGLAVGGGIVLAVNDQIDLIERLSREAMVSGGAALSELGEQLKATGKDVSSAEIATAIRQIDIEDETYARYLCSDDNRPVLLGRYIRSVIDVLDSKVK